ncbi:TRAM domain-containing protein [Halorubrum ezzemoulense]|jgi:predicted RNA-binding protein with TRAM domain|uniref:TRAM domain-containing protein n=1 Tax=Halorubrum ezzemoulense TaxID=337243 RepID=UPI002330C165|nr:TRAM domain-containing protein [Halorubrum ezzemoulense]MDB9281748.1 TRAM domain-containing protein [Halorubrum ezzemoulense]MDB9285292.1 TRAM domain-containing protein [Halorubrum ezzemoulense]
MEISDQLQCLFSGKVEEHNGSYVIEIPEQELRPGDLEADETYRVALLPSPTTSETNTTDDDSQSQQTSQTPPVEEGEQRTVEIEDIGDQGDGITRVERGFVVIVPDTKQTERVTIEITDVRENVAFAEVVDRISYYE